MSLRSFGIGCLSFIALGATSSAQGAAPTLYRLDAPASYEEGCQPPCLCPIQFTDDLFGTFTLTFDHADPAGYAHYNVDQVNWAFDFGGPERRATGTGEYKVGGQVAVMHELTLDLSIDGAAPVHFDSGLVQDGSAFPKVDIAIAQNGFYCYDRVFNVVASPVPVSQIAAYNLRRSAYQEGCFPPCLCPLMNKRRALGTFGLVDLGPASNPSKLHFALVNIAWQVAPVPAPPNLTFTGFGIYSLDTNAAEHRLVCDLTDGHGTTQRFDSGLVSGGSAFPPAINVDISVNGFYCYDQVVYVRARP